MIFKKKIYGFSWAVTETYLFLSYDGYVKLLCYLLIAYLYLISYNADLIRAMGYVAQVSDMAQVCFILLFVCMYLWSKKNGT